VTRFVGSVPIRTRTVRPVRCAGMEEL
jgi:hypothetical protein